MLVAFAPSYRKFQRIPSRRISQRTPVQHGALLRIPFTAVIRVSPIPGSLRSYTMATDPQDAIENRCEACFGTGNANSSMHSPYPHRKILHVDCPVCNGTGKKPKAS